MKTIEKNLQTYVCDSDDLFTGYADSPRIGETLKYYYVEPQDIESGKRYLLECRADN